MKMAQAFLATTIGILLLSEDSLPQWSNDASQNLKVAGGGINPEICIDGNGGCFIVWETGTSGNRRLLRMQHLNRYGYKSFPESGISLAGEEFDQSTPFFLTYGGEGTAIVLFYDTRVVNGQWIARTLVQRVDTTGALLWGNSAVRPAQSDSSQLPVALLADGNGGAFVFWAGDHNGDGVQEMFGNRITANGQLLWEQNGKKFADYAFNYTRTQVVTDGSEGLFCAFTQSTGIAIQRMNGNGEFLWPAAIPMSVGIWGVLTSDNNGGFFWVAHEEIAYRPPIGRIFRTRVFRYDSAGVSPWPTTGVAITDSAYEQTFSPEVLVNDQQDVAIIYRALAGTFNNIYVQRINFEGKLIFEYGGLPVSIYPASRAIKQTCLGNNGKITVVWRDGRIPRGDIYAQSLGQNGDRIWDNEVGVTLRPDSERSHKVSSDGNGGCIVAWYEIGTGSGWGIFAQQISRNGKLGEVQTTSVRSEFYDPSSSNTPFSFSLYPNPFKDTVQFTISSEENLPIVIEIFDLAGRKVWQNQNYNHDHQKVTVHWDGRNKEGKFLTSGIYLTKITVGKHTANQKVVLIR